MKQMEMKRDTENKVEDMQRRQQLVINNNIKIELKCIFIYTKLKHITKTNWSLYRAISNNIKLLKGYIERLTI